MSKSDERGVKSVVLEAFGNYDQIKVEYLPLHNPGSDEVEVNVHYCGVNFCDIVSRIGLVGQTTPFILGIECSGTVTALGTQTQDLPKLKIGDKVICYNFFGGMYREKVVVKRKHCYLLPENVNLREAAASFVNYLTAYCCLFELGNLKPGQKIFIKSCAGGVGWAATQLAKSVKDVTVFGTCSDSKTEVVTQNGVDYCFSHKTNYIRDIRKIAVGGVDLVIENEAIGDFSLVRSLLSPLGMVVAIGANNIVQDTKKLSVFSFLKLWWGQKNISMQELMMFNRAVSGLHLGLLAEQNPLLVRKIWKKLGRMMQAGKIKPRIDSEWQLDDVVEATKKMAERKNIGKILIKVNKSNNHKK